MARDNSQSEFTPYELQNLQYQKENTENTRASKNILGKMTGERGSEMLATIAMRAYQGAKNVFNAVQGGIADDSEFVRNNIELIREKYGGMMDEVFGYRGTSAASNAVKRYSILTDAYAKKTSEAIMGSEKTGAEVMKKITSKKGNILENLIGSPEDAVKNVESILEPLTTVYGNEMKKLSEEQVVKLAFYEESLGTSADALRNMFEKQIGFTGEMQTDSLDKLGAYASNLSDKLNIPMKKLTEMSVEMMSNTQMFGDITVEEATRMSAKLSQLGFTMEQLNAQQQKFGTFQSAAQAAGTMAQLTGVQVDAMKMSYLTSEGKFDELLEYQRDSLHQAGFTKEKFLNQSNAMRNAIADSYGRSQEEMAVLLDKNRQISSQEELTALMKEGDVAEEEGFDRLLENIDQTKMAMKDMDELYNDQRKKIMLETQRDLYAAAESQAELNTRMAETLDLVGRDKITKHIGDMTKQVKDWNDNIDPKQFVNNTEGFFDKIEEKGKTFMLRLTAMRELANDVKKEVAADEKKEAKEYSAKYSAMTAEQKNALLSLSQAAPIVETKTVVNVTVDQNGKVLKENSTTDTRVIENTAAIKKLQNNKVSKSGKSN